MESECKNILKCPLYPWWCGGTEEDECLINANKKEDDENGKCGDKRNDRKAEQERS